MSTVNFENCPSTNTPLNADNLNKLNYRPKGGGIVLNSNMQLWQRGISFISPNNQYTADRWRIVNNVNTNVDITQVAGLEDGNEFALRMEANASGVAGAASNLRQRINKPTLYSNKIYTLQARVKIDSGKSMRLAIIKDNTTVITSQTFVGDGTLQTYEITSTDVGIISTQFDAEIKLIRDTGVVATDGLTIQWVKFEVGEVATDFEPKTLEEVENDCYPYFERIQSEGTNFITNGWAQASTESRHVIQYIKKIQTPTISVSSATHFDFSNGGGNLTGSNVSTPLNAIDRAVFILTIAGATNGQGGGLRFNTASGYIDIDSEL